MIGKITIFCFAASYLVALALEFSRLLFRSGVRGVVMLVFAAAGIAAHTLFLLHRWLGEGHAALASEFDWYLVAAWALAATYLTLVYFHPRNPIGIFCLPLVLALVGVAWYWADREPFPRAEGTRLFQTTHGVLQLLGAVSVLIGFAAGLMYLMQSYRLRHKLPPRRGFELPSLEWLGRTSERAIVASVVFLLGGFATGLMVSRLRHGQVWWSDPVVWASSLLSAWMALVALFNFAYKPARQGKKVAYLTIGTFGFLVLTLAALLVGHEHGATDPAGPVVHPAVQPGDGP